MIKTVMDGIQNRFQRDSVPAIRDECRPVVRDTDSIDVLGMSRRARNALVRCGIRTVGELKRVVALPRYVESLYGIGQKSAAEIRRAVEPLLAASEIDEPLQDDAAGG